MLLSFHLQAGTGRVFQLQKVIPKKYMTSLYQLGYGAVVLEKK